MKTRRSKNNAPPMTEIFTVAELEDIETVCQVCEAEFLDEADLKLHVAQVHLNESNGKTICKVCWSILPGDQEFVSHFIFKHLENSTFCFYCYRVFSNPLLLEQHTLKHCVLGGDSPVTCSQCCSIFPNRHELQNHEYQKHGDSEDGLLLNKYFSLLSSALNIKIKKFLDSICKKKPVVCCKCKHSSSHIAHFIEHLKTFQCWCFACDKCFSVYKNKNGIINHMNSLHSPYSDRKKPTKKVCPKCLKYFDVTELSTHRKSCIIIKCSTCQKTFDSVNELTDHQNQEHSVKISLETCKICKKQFVGTLSLKKHISRSHKDRSLYKYRCVHCDSTFNHPSKLFAHFFSQHKDIEPYTCKICKKCFRLRKNFTIHIKLEHKSIGFVEFDENLHVTFSDKKSETPIAPQAVMDMDITTDSTSDCDVTPAKKPKKRNIKQHKSQDDVNSQQSTDLDAMECTTLHNDVKGDEEPGGSNPIITIKIEHLDEPKEQNQRIVRSSNKRQKNEKLSTPTAISDSSDEEPLSHIRKTLLRPKNRISNLKRKIKMRDKRARLTCKICKKYCYTVQNFHHHITLHEKTNMRRCVKCNKYFKSKKEFTNHIDSFHSNSKLIETLKSIVEKRRKVHPVSTGESFKSILEKRRKQQLITAQNSAVNKFQRTIRKVNIVDDCTATLTPMTDHGLSVKNFIENFKPETDSGNVSKSINISNSVTLKVVSTPTQREPMIKMRAVNTGPDLETLETCKLRFPVKFKESPASAMNTKITVKLVQQLVTKPIAVNMSYNEKIPAVQEKSEDYCNMFADETDYTQYKNESIPEVAQEVMLEDLEDIPRTRRLAQEVVIPKIPKEHGGVRIGHLLPQAPFYKIVNVKKLIDVSNNQENGTSITNKPVELPDGTRLVSVKNPYSHLIPNEHLEAILKANKAKYYTPKAKNIEKAIAKALNQVKPPRRRGGRKVTRN